MVSVLDRMYVNLPSSIPIHHKIHIWIGPRSDLMRVMRILPKVYTQLRTDEIDVVQETVEPEQKHSIPLGSYNLFHQTNMQFHLIYDGDLYSEKFIDTIHAYCTIDDIMIPRIWGGGTALKVEHRPSVVVFSEDDGWVPLSLKPYVTVLSVLEMMTF